MKLKASLHFSKKRRKRRRRELLWRMGAKQQFSTSFKMINNNDNKATTTTTTHRRRPNEHEKRRESKNKHLLKYLIILVLTMQLACDTLLFGAAHLNAHHHHQQQHHVHAQETADASFGQPTASFSTENNDTDFEYGPRDGQHLAYQTGDVLAYVGQPDVQISCVVANKRESLIWLRNDAMLANELRFHVAKDRYWSSVSKLPLSSVMAGSTLASNDNILLQSNESTTLLVDSRQPNLSIANLIETRTCDAQSALKYTLHLRNVELADEGTFQCLVDNNNINNNSDNDNNESHEQPSTAGRRLRSRRMRLSVLQAPASLDVAVVVQGEARSQENATPAHSKQDDNDDLQLTTRVEIVRHNTQIRLECRANQAKPRAELAWYDPDGVEVARGRDLQASEYASDSFVEEFNRLESPQHNTSLAPTLHTTTLVWSFKVKREHHNKVFTCSARHPALELMFAAANTTTTSDQKRNFLRQSVRLDVLYEPSVELVRDYLGNPDEFASIRFYCNAHARPNDLTYMWLVDDQLVPAANESSLFIGRLTRQMHLRDIKCIVNNSIGSNSSQTRVGIRYSPAYVTHLLPASVQPEHHYQHVVATPAATTNINMMTMTKLLRNQQQQSVKSLKRKSSSSSTTLKQRENIDEDDDDQKDDDATINKSASQRIKRLFEQLDSSISRELAFGAHAGEDVTLRCDFDSNPKPIQIVWFKISTEYSVMRDVTPSEADDLIEFGANHAIFTVPSNDEQLKSNNDKLASRPTTSKRHISIGHTDAQSTQIAHLNNNAQQQVASGGEIAGQQQLDFEQMSNELLVEMNFLEAQQKLAQQQTTGAAAGGGERNIASKAINFQSSNHLIEPLVGEPASSEHFRIHEPLVVQMRTRQRLRMMTSNNNMRQRKINESLIEQQHELLTPELVLLNRKPTKNNVDDDDDENDDTYRTIDASRTAHVFSSSISLKNVNDDAIGKYVCKAVASDGFKSAAKSIYFVLKQSPRIISVNQQWAPLGATQMRLECLAQINAVQDNETQIIWLKDGKQIDVMHKSLARHFGGERSISIAEQLSPDGLFLRSILRINGSDFNDFGTYNCTIVNSIDKDSMLINLQPSAPTGFAFKLMASLTVGSIVLFLAIVCLIFAINPCKQFDALSSNKPFNKQLSKKSKDSDHQAAMVVSSSSHNQASQAHDECSSASSDASNERQEQRQFESSVSLGGVTNTTYQHSTSLLRGAGNVYATNNSPLAAFTPASGLFAHHTTDGAESSASSSACTRPASAFSANTFVGYHSNHNHQYPLSAANLPPTSRLMQHQAARASLRLPTSCRSQAAPITSGANVKFAAIHESLEHKLQLGNANLHKSPQTTTTSAQLNSNNNDTCRNSFLARMRSKLVNVATCPSKQQRDTTKRQPRSGRAINTNHKRPTISLPINANNNERALVKRASFSNNLNNHNEAQGFTKANGEQQHKHLMMMHLTHLGGTSSHLVSSSANLIQDSSATDNATTSSGRSSSTSGGPALNQQMQTNHMIAQLTNTEAQDCTDYVLTQQQQQQQPFDPTTLFYMQQQQQFNCDNNLYANGPQQTLTTTTPTNGYEQQVYANNNCNHQALNHQAAINDNNQATNYTTFQHSWNTDPTNNCGLQLTDENCASIQRHVANGHYQMPVLTLDGGVIQTKQQQENTTTTCYATICPNGSINKITPSTPSFSSNNIISYGTLPNIKQEPILVPTSDGGDAYFESNYGTLLSKSSAYKTLGYNMPTNSHLLENNHNHQTQAVESTTSSSSTPNSLTTHANVSSSLNINQIQHSLNMSQAISQHIRSVALIGANQTNNSANALEQTSASLTTSSPSQDVVTNNTDSQQQSSLGTIIASNNSDAATCELLAKQQQQQQQPNTTNVPPIDNTLATHV